MSGAQKVDRAYINTLIEQAEPPTDYPQTRQDYREDLKSITDAAVKFFDEDNLRHCVQEIAQDGAANWVSTLGPVLTRNEKRRLTRTSKQVMGKFLKEGKDVLGEMKKSMQATCVVTLPCVQITQVPRELVATVADSNEKVNLDRVKCLYYEQNDLGILLVVWYIGRVEEKFKGFRWTGQKDRMRTTFGWFKDNEIRTDTGDTVIPYNQLERYEQGERGIFQNSPFSLPVQLDEEVKTKLQDPQGRKDLGTEQVFFTFFDWQEYFNLMLYQDVDQGGNAWRQAIRAELVESLSEFANKKQYDDNPEIEKESFEKLVTLLYESKLTNKWYTEMGILEAHVRTSPLVLALLAFLHHTCNVIWGQFLEKMRVDQKDLGILASLDAFYNKKTLHQVLAADVNLLLYHLLGYMIPNQNPGFLLSEKMKKLLEVHLIQTKNPGWAYFEAEQLNPPLFFTVKPTDKTDKIRFSLFFDGHLLPPSEKQNRQDLASRVFPDPEVLTSWYGLLLPQLDADLAGMVQRRLPVYTSWITGQETPRLTHSTARVLSTRLLVQRIHENLRENPPMPLWQPVPEDNLLMGAPRVAYFNSAFRFLTWAPLGIPIYQLSECHMGTGVWVALQHGYSDKSNALLHHLPGSKLLLIASVQEQEKRSLPWNEQILAALNTSLLSNKVDRTGSNIMDWSVPWAYSLPAMGFKQEEQAAKAFCSAINQLLLGYIDYVRKPVENYQKQEDAGLPQLNMLSPFIWVLGNSKPVSQVLLDMSLILYDNCIPFAFVRQDVHPLENWISQLRLDREALNSNLLRFNYPDEYLTRLLQPERVQLIEKQPMPQYVLTLPVYAGSMDRRTTDIPGSIPVEQRRRKAFKRKIERTPPSTTSVPISMYREEQEEEEEEEEEKPLWRSRKRLQRESEGSPEPSLILEEPAEETPYQPKELISQMRQSVTLSDAGLPENLRHLAAQYEELKMALQALQRKNPQALQPDPWNTDALLWALYQSVENDLAPSDWFMLLLYDDPLTQSNLANAISAINNSTRRTQQSLLASIFSMIAYLIHRSMAFRGTLENNLEELPRIMLLEYRACLSYALQFTTPALREKVKSYFDAVFHKGLGPQGYTEQFQQFMNAGNITAVEDMPLLPPFAMVTSEKGPGVNMDILRQNPAIVFPELS